MPPPLPLHPAIIHFPIAGTFFAVAALVLALVRPGARSASVTAAALLLAAALTGGIAAAVTGYLWADQLAYLSGGWGPIPGPKAVEGLAQKHALLAVAFLVAAASALALVLSARRRDRPTVLALLVTLVACGLVAATGYLGGTMVHAPPEPVDAAAPPPR